MGCRFRTGYTTAGNAKQAPDRASCSGGEAVCSSGPGPDRRLAPVTRAKLGAPGLDAPLGLSRGAYLNTFGSECSDNARSPGLQTEPELDASAGSSKGSSLAGWYEVRRWRRDVQVAFHPEANMSGPGGERGEIGGLSPESRARLRFVLLNARVSWVAWIALTYPAVFPSDGRVVKADLNRLLVSLRRCFPGLVYAWCLEFQKRGAPHFHMLLDREIAKEDLAKLWHRAIASTDPKHLRAGVRVESVRSQGRVAHYMVSFLARMDMLKASQKQVPEAFSSVGRFWGTSRGLVDDPAIYVSSLPSSADLVRTLRKLSEKRAKKRLRNAHRTGGGGFMAFNASQVANRLLEAERGGETWLEV